MLTLQEYSKTIIFPIGNTNDAYTKYFIGQSYIAPISTEQVKIYNVTFEPKCRNNWHIHRAKSGGTTVNVTKLDTKEQSVPNIKADYISITSGNNIGDYNTELYVQTPSMADGGGLVYSAANGNSYIRGIEDLKIVSGNSGSDVRIVAEGNNTIIEDLIVGGNFTNTSNNTTVTGKHTAVGNAIINATNNIQLTNIKAGKEMNITSQNKIRIGYAEGGTLNLTTGSTDVEIKADIKNAGFGEQMSEKTVNFVYDMLPTAQHISNYTNGTDEATITDMNGRVIDYSNIMDVVNTVGEEPTPIDIKRKIKELNVLGYAG